MASHWLRSTAQVTQKAAGAIIECSQSKIAQIEAGRNTIRRAELIVLLQTEECARQLPALESRLSDKEVDRRIVVRMQRQQRLIEPNPLQLSVVLSESALLRCARQSTVAVSQFRHLSEQARRDNIELLVMPIDVGLYIGVSGGFSLLSFPDGLLPDVVHQEYLVGGPLIDAQSLVDLLTRIYEELRGQALGANESLALITELIDHTR